MKKKKAKKLTEHITTCVACKPFMNDLYRRNSKPPMSWTMKQLCPVANEIYNEK